MKRFRLGFAVAASMLSMIAAPMAVAGTAPDAAAGGALFKMRCLTCHTAVAGQPNSIGPNLAGVVGRKAGSVTFNYSDALKSSGLVWDKPTLDKFLSAPRTLVPGTRMLIAVPDAKQRGDLIAYLGGLSK